MQKFSLLKNLSKLTGGYATYLTIKSYHQNDNLIKAKANLENQNSELIETINNMYEKGIVQEVIINKAKEQLEIVQDSFTKVKTNTDTLSNSYTEYNKIKSDSLLNKLTESTDETVNSMNILGDSLSKLKNILKDDSNNFIPFDFSNFTSDYQQFLDHLTQNQKFALIHILLSIIIFISLLNMVGLYLGDRIIIYFKLEDKYPRLAKIIQLRRKVLTYYFLLDSLFIVLALIVIIGFNIYNIL